MLLVKDFRPRTFWGNVMASEKITSQSIQVIICEITACRLPFDKNEIDSIASEMVRDCLFGFGYWIQAPVLLAGSCDESSPVLNADAFIFRDQLKRE